MKLSIAGIVLDINANFESYSAYETAAPAADLCVGCAVRDEIKALELSEAYGVRHFIEEFGVYNGRFVSQDRAGENSLATLVFEPDFKKVSCELVDVEAKGGASLASRMNVAVRDAVVNCLPAFGAITFHSSAISFNGQALLFAAPSGTGKSTQTGLWKEAYPDCVTYINDDTPVLKKFGGVFHACGSPWAGTSGINNNISAPLKAIVFVERGEENSIRELRPAEKVIRSLRAVRSQLFPIQRERQAKLVFELASVPMFELRCTISREAVETVKSLLF